MHGYTCDVQDKGCGGIVDGIQSQGRASKGVIGPQRCQVPGTAMVALIKLLLVIIMNIVAVEQIRAEVHECLGRARCDRVARDMDAVVFMQRGRDKGKRAELPRRGDRARDSRWTRADKELEERNTSRRSYARSPWTWEHEDGRAFSSSWVRSGEETSWRDWSSSGSGAAFAKAPPPLPSSALVIRNVMLASGGMSRDSRIL